MFGGRCIESQCFFDSHCGFDKGDKVVEAMDSHREGLKKKASCASDQKGKVMSKYLDPISLGQTQSSQIKTEIRRAIVMINDFYDG